MSETFDTRFQTFRAQVRVLDQRAHNLPTEIDTLLPFIVESLAIACEELHVAEAELRQQNTELVQAYSTGEAQRQRYQDLFEFAPDAYLVTDGAGVIQETNRAASDVFGLARTYLRGKPVAAFVLPEEQREFRSQIEAMRRRVDQSVWAFEARLRSRGRREPTDVSMRVVIERHGAEIVCMFWMARDITAQKQAVAEVRRLNLEFERRVRERTGELEATTRVYRDLLAQEQASRARVETALREKVAQLETLAGESNRLLQELDQSTAAATRVSRLVEQVLPESDAAHRQPAARIAGQPRGLPLPPLALLA